MPMFSAVVKERLLSSISAIEQRKEHFVAQPGKSFTRNRKLGFQTCVKLMLSIGGGSLGNEMLDFFSHSPDTVSPSAFVQSRKKLSSEVFKVLLQDFTHGFDHLKTPQGYRAIAVDGSALNIPHDPKDTQTYFQSTPGSRGFNQVHINAMYDLVNKVYLDASVQPGRELNEFRALTDMVDNSTLEDKVLIVADRGYESYNVFAHIIEKGWKFLIRVRDKSSKGISMLSTFDLPESGQFDKQITRLLTRKQTNKVKARPDLYKFVPSTSTFDYLEKKSDRFYPLSLRVVRIVLEDGSSQCFITNLEPEEAPPDKIRELYHLRWGIETSFREIKHTLALTHLHSKKEEHIIQEIFAKMIMYNFCSIITSHVVIEKSDRRHAYKVNFSKAVHICKYFFRGDDVHPPDVEALIQKYILPIRMGRSSPRRIRFSSFVSFNYRVS